MRREDSADENRAEHPSSSGSDRRRKIPTKREPREVRYEQTSITEQHVPRRISGKKMPSEHIVAVTTHKALDGYRAKTMRISDVDNNTLDWLDTTKCDFSVTSARDEMRHIIEAMNPMSSLGLRRIRTEDAGVKTKITWNFCANCTKCKRRAIASSKQIRE